MTGKAARLLALEHEDQRLSKRMHQDQVRRREIQEERLRLRVAFTHDDRRAYETRSGR